MKRILNTFLGIILTISLVLLISPKVHAMGLISGQVYKNVDGVRVGLGGVIIDYNSVDPSDEQETHSGNVVSRYGDGHWAMPDMDCGRGTYTFTPRNINQWGEFHPGSYTIEKGFGNRNVFTGRDFEWVLDMTLTVDSGCENNAPVNTINWNVNADLNEFRVWRNGGGTDGWIVQNLPANTRSYKDTNVTPGTTYTYFVWGQNSGVGGSQTWANEAVGIAVTTDTNCNPPPVPQSLIIQQGPAGIGFQQGSPSTANYSRSGLTASQQGSNYYNDLTIQPTVSSVTPKGPQGNLQYIATSFVPNVITYNQNTPLSIVLNDVNRFGSFLVLYAHCGNESIPCTAGNQTLSPGNYYIYSPRMNPNWRPLTTDFIGDSSSGLQARFLNSQVYVQGTQTLSPIFDIFIYKTFPNQIWNTYNHMKTVTNGQVVETNILAQPCDTNGNCASSLTEE